MVNPSFVRYERAAFADHCPASLYVRGKTRPDFVRRLFDLTYRASPALPSANHLTFCGGLHSGTVAIEKACKCWSPLYAPGRFILTDWDCGDMEANGFSCHDQKNGSQSIAPN